MRKNMICKTLVMGIFFLFVGVTVHISTGKIDTSNININDGSLLGYVNDKSGNPIEGALVRVYFHETYEEDYSDENGYYHVTNIPICYCLKNATCSKDCYKTEWVLLSIIENTSYDFILNTSNHPPKAPKITGPGSVPSESIKVIVENPVNSPPGEPIEFKFEAIDPDGDGIRYHIDWGDGIYEITEFYPSGVEVKVNHTYSSQGTYIVSVFAEDTCGFKGPVGTLSISIWSIFINDNNEIEPMDYNEEIITLIDGLIWFENYEFCYKPIIKKIEVWIGRDPFSYLKITGYKKPIFPIDNCKFNENPNHIIANRFVGWIFQCDQFYCSVRGVALGNIDWS